VITGDQPNELQEPSVTFTGGSWSFRYTVENVEFGRLAGAYLSYRRSRKRWAHLVWRISLVMICGGGFGLIAGFLVFLASAAYRNLLPTIGNRELDQFLWAILMGAVVLGLMAGFRRLNTIVETPKPSGPFEFEIVVNDSEIHSRTRGMIFRFDFKDLRELIELKSCFCFVHPMTVIVFIPRRVFPSAAMAEEFATFCQKALRDQT